MQAQNNSHFGQFFGSGSIWNVAECNGAGENSNNELFDEELQGTADLNVSGTVCTIHSVKSEGINGFTSCTFVIFLTKYLLEECLQPSQDI